MKVSIPLALNFAGVFMAKIGTGNQAQKKFEASIASFTSWMKSSIKNRKISKPCWTIQSKYRGYWKYYGVMGNFGTLKSLCYETKRALLKWLNKRSQGLVYNWTYFDDLLKQFAIPGLGISENPNLNLQFL